MDTCKGCRFWEQKETKAPQNGVVQGVCHFNPPTTTGCFVPNVNRISGQLQPQLVELTIWPVTASIGWCGGFEEKDCEHEWVTADTETVEWCSKCKETRAKKELAEPIKDK